MKVLLVRPPTPAGIFTEAGHPPLGLGYLSEALARAGIEDLVMDMPLGYHTSDLTGEIGRFRPDIIGFSLMTFQYRSRYALMEEARRAAGPETLILAGGPHASLFRDRILDECPAVDAVVVMEGEDPLVEIASGADPSRTRGVITRSGPPPGTRSFVTDLDRLGYPRYGRFELDRYPGRAAGIITSRGCPYLCTFCPIHLAIGRKYRVRSAPSIVEEIEYLYGLGMREILVLDDNFTLIRERAVEILDGLKELKLPGIRLGCPNGIRADKVDREILSKMREVGFVSVSFGVEAGNDRMLELLKKGERMENIKRAIRDACDVGLEVTLFFLLGSLGETEADIRDSFELALEYPIHKASFYNIIPFPGSEMFEELERSGRLLSSPEEYLNDASHFRGEPCFTTPELGMDERRRIFDESRRVSREVRRREMARRLNARGGAWRMISPLARLYPFDHPALSTPLVRRIRRSLGL